MNPRNYGQIQRLKWNSWFIQVGESRVDRVPRKADALRIARTHGKVVRVDDCTKTIHVEATHE